MLGRRFFLSQAEHLFKRSGFFCHESRRRPGSS
jgi:hypothetical protein